jgi:hypothetical protein
MMKSLEKKAISTFPAVSLDTSQRFETETVRDLGDYTEYSDGGDLRHDDLANTQTTVADPVLDRSISVDGVCCHLSVVPYKY